jgi:hypothetical protein
MESLKVLQGKECYGSPLRYAHLRLDAKTMTKAKQRKGSPRMNKGKKYSTATRGGFILQVENKREEKAGV